MRSFGWLPSPAEQGFEPGDALHGHCTNCTFPLDESDMQSGRGVYRDDVLLCLDCEAGRYRCSAGCGESVPSPATMCAACEEYQ